MHTPEQLCEVRLPWGKKLRAWDDLLWGGHDKYPEVVSSTIRTTIVERAVVDEDDGWEIRAVEVTPTGSTMTQFKGGWPFPRPADAVRPLDTGSNCPRCGRPLEKCGQLGVVPHAWEALAYRCDACGFGFSNAIDPNSRRIITRSPESNVPKEARDGVLDVLGRAVNERNRPSKRWKFCSETSEDAITWAVVHALQRSERLAQLLPADMRPSPTDPSVLLWGVPICGPDASDIADRLEQISRGLGEKPTARTEPDVIVGWSDVLAIVEAKLGSRNELKHSDYAGWPLYESPSYFDAPLERVAETGLYELARNWRIGSELAGDRRFVLVNLAPTTLEPDASRLRGVIRETPARRLVSRTWGDALVGAPEWIRTFAVKRGAIPLGAELGSSTPELT